METSLIHSLALTSAMEVPNPTAMETSLIHSLVLTSAMEAITAMD
jgi:hypothetical protein